MSDFMKKVSAAVKQQKKDILDKLKGESYLYMGDPALQWGVGGWIRGRCNLLYGPSASAKSTLALKAAVSEQKKTNGYIVIFDSEYSYKDPFEVNEKGELTEAAKQAQSRYEKFGVNLDKLFLIQSNNPNTLFGELGTLESDIKKGKFEVSAIIVDSWGGVQQTTAAKKIEEGEITAAGEQFGGNAKLMGPILQTLLRIAAETGTTMFFVQHCIQDMKTGGWKLIGGEKLRFLVHCIVFLESVRAKDALLLTGNIATTKDTTYDEIIEPVGKKIRFRCEKSREQVEGRKGEFWVNFEEAEYALPEVSLFNLATQLGIIDHPFVTETDKKGNPIIDEKTGKPKVKVNNMYWEFPVGAPTPMKWHGAKNAIEALKDKKIFDDVYNKCLNSSRKNAIDDKLGDELQLSE